METSHPHLIWANKPQCSRPVAELWVSDDDLWFVMFVDDLDRSLKIEILPSSVDKTYVLDLTEMERLIEAARRELLDMASAPPCPPEAEKKTEKSAMPQTG